MNAEHFDVDYYKLVVSKKRCVVIEVGNRVSLDGDTSIILPHPIAKIISHKMPAIFADKLVDALRKDEELSAELFSLLLPGREYELVRIVPWG